MTDRDHTFVFADLAGFTALTEAHGDERAADIALQFCAELNSLLPEDAEDLKMLGDACLVRVGRADEAVQLGVQLTSALATRHGFPNVRLGMHTGPAARRGMDWFGSTVNTAARVAELAGPGDVLLTAVTRAAAGSPPGLHLEDCGRHELRHIREPAHLFLAHSIAPTGREGLRVVDPVCQMLLDVERAATTVTEDGTERFFCSSLCAEQFLRSPDRYLRDLGAGPPRRIGSRPLHLSATTRAEALR